MKKENNLHLVSAYLQAADGVGIREALFELNSVAADIFWYSRHEIEVYFVSIILNVYGNRKT